MTKMYQFRVTFETKLFQTERYFWLANREDGQALRAALAKRFPGVEMHVDFCTIDHVLSPDMAAAEVADEIAAHDDVALGR